MSVCRNLTNASLGQNLQQKWTRKAEWIIKRPVKLNQKEAQGSARLPWTKATNEAEKRNLLLRKQQKQKAPSKNCDSVIRSQKTRARTQENQQVGSSVRKSLSEDRGAAGNQANWQEVE